MACHLGWILCDDNLDNNSFYVCFGGQPIKDTERLSAYYRCYFDKVFSVFAQNIVVATINKMDLKR